MAKRLVEASRGIGVNPCSAGSTLKTVKTAPKVTVIEVTMEDLHAPVREFEQSHPGYDRTNFIDFFRDEAGELIETADFHRVYRMYHRLMLAEKSE